MRRPHPKSHVTLRYHGRVTNKERYNSTFTRPMDSKLCSVVTQFEGTPPPSQSHVTYQLRGHGTNQRHYISTFARPMDPKLNRVVTQDEQTSPTMSRETSIKWSRDKSKIFYLHFHTVQGPQTQQSGNCKNEISNGVSTQHVTPLITPSRDKYPVGCVQLFHFQLKLSPKNRQISNDYDNTEMAFMVAYYLLAGCLCGKNILIGGLAP